MAPRGIARAPSRVWSEVRITSSKLWVELTSALKSVNAPRLCNIFRNVGFIASLLADQAL
jgi:hypothetical protein